MTTDNFEVKKRRIKKLERNISLLNRPYSLFIAKINDAKKEGLSEVELISIDTIRIFSYLLCRSAIKKLRRKGYKIRTNCTYMYGHFYKKCISKTWIAIL